MTMKNEKRCLKMDDDDDDDDVREQHTTTTQTPRKKERKKEKLFLPPKKRTMRSLEASSLVARVSPLVFFYGVLSRPFINNIKKEKERHNATFLGFQKRHSLKVRTLEC